MNDAELPDLPDDSSVCGDDDDGTGAVSTMNAEVEESFLGELEEQDLSEIGMQLAFGQVLQ